MSRFYTKSALLIFIICPVLILAACSSDGKDDDVILVKSDERPWLGVQIEDLSGKMLKNLGLEHGVKITKVLDSSPAEKAGLEKDDIIMSFDGNEITDAQDLVSNVKKSEVDQEVEIEYFREGKTSQATVKLAVNDRKNIIRWHSQFPDRKSFKMMQGTWLGVKTENLSDQLREFFAVPEEMGVLIKEVVDDSPAEKGGLQAGDVIIGVADREIKNTRDLSRSINYYNPDEEVEITFIREKNKKSLTIKLGEADFPHGMHFYGYDGDVIDIPDIDVDIPEIDVVIPEINHDEFLEQLKEIKEDINDKSTIRHFRIQTKISEV